MIIYHPLLPSIHIIVEEKDHYLSFLLFTFPYFDKIFQISFLMIVYLFILKSLNSI